MKMYCVFLEKRDSSYNHKTKRMENTREYLVSPCGSDSVFILDGRKNIENQLHEIFERIERFKRGLNKVFDGFIIYEGNSNTCRLDGREVYTYNPEGLEIKEI